MAVNWYGPRADFLWKKTDCVSCGQCVNACPCGALDYRSEKGRVFRAINDPTKTVVAFVAPAVRSVVSSISEFPLMKLLLSWQVF
jgi:formate dehydrogenase major subunit